METTVFNKLLKTLKADEENSLEIIGFSSVLDRAPFYNGQHVLSFYANEDTDYELVVEEFGYWLDDVWNEQQPTAEQLAIMKNTIDNEVEKLNKLQEQSEEELLEAEKEAEELQDTYDFIQANFQTHY